MKLSCGYQIYAYSFSVIFLLFLTYFTSFSFLVVCLDGRFVTQLELTWDIGRAWSGVPHSLLKSQKNGGLTKLKRKKCSKELSGLDDS